MSKTIDEPLLPKETDSVLINRYIDQFEAYQVQAYKSTRHLRCYLV